VSVAVSETVNKSGESETSEVIKAMVARVTMENMSESDSADWEQAVQLRLMELDVDPGNDAAPGANKRAGN